MFPCYVYVCFMIVVYKPLFLYTYLSIPSSSPDGAYEYTDADRKTFYTRAGRPVKDAGGTGL